MKNRETQGHCPKCRAAVIRAVGHDGQLIMLDVQPSPVGSYKLVRFESGILAAQLDGEQWDLYGECDDRRYILHRLMCPVEG